MHVVHLRLSRKDAAPASGSDADELLDALWAHSTEDDGLEHIRLRAHAGDIELVLFFRESSNAEPVKTSADIVLRALRASKRLTMTYRWLYHVS